MVSLHDPKSVEAADVFKGQRKAGQLRRIGGGTEFVYSPDYLSDPGPAVATTLPVQSAPFFAGGGAVPAFFAGLLPEGARLNAVASAVKTSLNDELSLLLAVGSDTVGDVSVVHEGSTPDDLSPRPRSDLSDLSFAELFALSISGNREDLDRAIPGVQDKLSDAMISFPVPSRFGPAILKLTPDRYPKLVENEAFFLDLAATCGFKVPAHQVIHDNVGAAGLLIQRFDRNITDGSVTRLGQEDACQLSNRWPADKYRLSMREVCESIVSVVSSPFDSMLTLIEITVFSYLIVNGDMHAKNLSVGWYPELDLVSVTPMYDLVTTHPYPVDNLLALPVDGRANRIRLADVAGFGGRFGVPEKLVRRKVLSIAETVQDHIDQVGAIGLEEPATDGLQREMRARITGLTR